MIGSRTIKTLTALLASMTVGTFALMMLNTAPIRPSATNLAAVDAADAPAEAVFQTDVPVQAIKWRNIVIHSSGQGRRDVASACHFIVDSTALDSTALVRVSKLWRRQSEGTHVLAGGADFNANSIGICLMGDFSAQPPSKEQFRSLVTLVRTIQQTCRIPADHVYLNSQLDARSTSPGAAFPERAFAQQLLSAIR